MKMASFSSGRSFADAAQAEVRPNKNQAIIIPLPPDVQVDDCVYAIGEQIGPQNITYAAKIANNRLFIMLTKKELVDRVIANPNQIKINNQNIEVRRYVNDGLRIIISHFLPFISVASVESALIKCGLKLISKITPLGAGLSKENYNHVKGLKRQVFVEPNDNIEIPQTLLIPDDDTEYRIFLTADITCLHCRKKGHKVRSCPEKQNNPSSFQESIFTGFPNLSQNNQTLTQTTTIQTNQPKTLEAPELTPNQETNINDLNQINPAQEPTLIFPPLTPLQNQSDQQKNLENTQSSQTDKNINEPSETQVIHTDEVLNKDCEEYEKTQSNKRSAPSLSSIENESLTDENEEEKNRSPNERSRSVTKKAKNESGPKLRSVSPRLTGKSIEEILKPLKSKLKNNPKIYKITYKNLYDFLEEVQGTTEHLAIARKYTPDINALLNTLHELHGNLNDRSTKYKITKLTNRLSEQLQAEALNEPISSQKNSIKN